MSLPPRSEASSLNWPCAVVLPWKSPSKSNALGVRMSMAPPTASPGMSGVGALDTCTDWMPNGASMFNEIARVDESVSGMPKPLRV